VLLVKNERAHGDPAAASVAQRADERRIGAACDMDILPQAGLAVAPRCADGAVEERLDDPRIAADGRAAVAVAPPSVVLDVEEGADGDDADTERVRPAAAALCVILADHGRLLYGVLFRVPALRPARRGRSGGDGL